MPQIKINEIDQSIVTTVVKDDRVKVFVPIIASFGPWMEVRGFTDVSDFYKTFGYTEPMYNPIENDVSRLYATELIKRGAEVYAIRVNDGSYGGSSSGGTTIPARSGNSVLDCVYDSTRSSETAYTSRFITVPASYTILYKVGEGETVTKQITIGSTTTYIFKGVYDGASSTLKKNLNDAKTLGDTYAEVQTVTQDVADEIDASVTSLNAYFALQSTKNDLKATQFCEQITGISAKYSGSFGDNLMISITPINTTRLAESYQYANISVYYVDKRTNYTQKQDGTYDATTIVNSVRNLETKRVSTNPDDKYYFEDVEFDFITINCTDNARQDLALAWANIKNQPATNAILYSGFPTIPASYTGTDGQYTYNLDSMMWNGSDFGYTQDTLTFLKTRNFDGNFLSTMIPDDYDKYRKYQEEVYGTITPTGTAPNISYQVANNGLIANVYANLNICFDNYKDPYQYDFDFITSGGLLNDIYACSGKSSDSETLYVYIVNAVRDTNNIVAGTEELPGLIECHVGMKNLVTTRKDCIALCDVYKGYDPNYITDYVLLLNTSYATMHFPWCWITDPNTAKLTLMPPSFIFMYTFLSNLINSESSQKWFPPAGVKRATADVVVKPYFEIGSTLLDKWQNQGTVHVNPIMRLKQYGYVIYGQYTTLQAIDIFTHSALESLNVRLISNVVKKKIFDVCLDLAFEPNTSMLWNKFFNAMDDFLRYMKYNLGVYDYRVVMDESTVTTDDINHLRCPGKVYIAPTRTAEFFDIDFYITESGAVFND